MVRMEKELICKAKADGALYPHGEDFQLNKGKISINIKKDSELTEEESIAFYYDARQSP